VGIIFRILGEVLSEKISPIFKKRKIDHILDEITEHVSEWKNLAAEHRVPN
jgi:hypothetical protein